MRKSKFERIRYVRLLDCMTLHVLRQLVLRCCSMGKSVPRADCAAGVQYDVMGQMCHIVSGAFESTEFDMHRHEVALQLHTVQHQVHRLRISPCMHLDAYFI